jgi:hypothetical protein
MINPSYPDHPFKIKKEGEGHMIFDEKRRQWVILTPEEWVRQNVFQWLVQDLKYPQEMIAVEKEIRLFDLVKRFDLLVYDKDFQPWMMVECKAQSVPLTQQTLMQVLRYNIAIPVPYLLIINGLQAMAFNKVEGKLVDLDLMPTWSL